MTLFEYDREVGVSLLCGVDEAGRGPLAGDVYAAAVILPENCQIEQLNDSKKLTPQIREKLFQEIKERALSYAIATASVKEIEEYNILNATFLAMRRAVEGLVVTPALVLVDGNRNPELPVHSRCVVKGDSLSASIAAASILAKVARDHYMEEAAQRYPQYCFEKHKGYGTPLHYEMLAAYGPSPIHRLSFLKKHEPGNESPAQRRGRIGEEAVCEYLLKNGYEILSRNFNTLYGELDIIAKQKDILAVVEVKTRKEGTMAKGREAVGLAKQRKMIKSTALFLQENKRTEKLRFDVAEVTLSGQKNPKVSELNYLENAFLGGSEDACF